MSSNCIRTIVPIFSGGGTRLPAYVGILQALDELDIGFTTMVGVSGGSIVAALYAKGYSIDRLRELAFKTDFSRFTGFSFTRLLREGGLSSGNEFEQWIDNLLEGMTFEQCPYALHILATDINGGGPVLLNKEKSPDMRISEAIRYSMSVPLLFSFKQYQEHLLTDGAILSEDALFDDWQKDGTPSICFRLRSEAVKKPFVKYRKIGLPQYVGLLIRTFMNAVSREYVHNQYWHSTLIVNTGSVSAVDFKMDEAAKQELFNVGYQTTKDFLPKKLMSTDEPTMI